MIGCLITITIATMIIMLGWMKVLLDYEETLSELIRRGYNGKVEPPPFPKINWIVVCLIYVIAIVVELLNFSL